MPTNTTKPTDETLEEASKDYAAYLKAFSRREDIRIDMRDLDDHNRRCRHIIRFNKEIISACKDGEVDAVVDVDHWGVER